MAARRSTRRSRFPASAVAALSLAILLVLIAVLWMLLHGRAPTSGADQDFELRLVEVAARHGVPAEGITADRKIQKVDGVFVRDWIIRLPSGALRDQLLEDLRLEVQARGGQMGAVTSGDGRSTRVRIDFELEAFALELEVVAPQRSPTATATPRPTATPTPRPTLPPQARGRLAIILDDGGQSMDLVSRAAALPQPVAVAVLPFLPFSAETASALHRAGHEVWLHLPMEPQDYPESQPGPGAIMVGMSENEIRTTVHAALNNVPHVVGVNNHMGSRATADLRTMTWVMQELSSRGMSFVDSRTTVDTVAELAARSQGVKVNRRHVFLDNVRTRDAVRAQLDEAVYRSRQDGECIAIGHLTGVTVDVLARELPGLAARGADLVPPTKLTK